jgi:repressor LexA
MTRPLTSRQRDAVEWIRAFILAHRYPPSIREIGLGLGIRSNNAVADLLDALESRGAIRRTPRKARALEVL